MAQLEFTMKVISPMFLNGADTRQPEMRAASVRGQLRYWLRAILGAQTDDLNQIWERESAVFGSTGQGSAVSVRVFGRPKPEVEKSAMLPHRKGSRDNPSMADAIRPDQTFELQMVTRPGVKIPNNAINALQLWSLLGGLGKRSRRMMGAVEIRPKTTTQQWYEKLHTPEAFKNAIISVLNNALASPISTSKMPRFPVLRPNHSWIIIGAPAANPEEANQEFFRQLLRNSRFRPQQDAFGFAKRNRRASPVIAQVRMIGGEYYPVITAFRSEPLERANYSDILRDFMRAAIKHYDGIHVWGGW